MGKGVRRLDLFGEADEALRGQPVLGKARNFQGWLGGWQGIEVYFLHMTPASYFTPPPPMSCRLPVQTYGALWITMSIRMGFTVRSSRKAVMDTIPRLIAHCGISSGISESFAISLPPVPVQTAASLPGGSARWQLLGGRAE